ncbi:hypothetical protein TWF506_001554 [Arthrobotrys conoides]|uniref:F-box domain-containing protein n=1 Tax=Arthrobotrys conoides TaxID=74498 RepID=A0AAN8NXU6_9PEZI
MASIVTLVRAPEVLDEILQYVSDIEALNLALTCRSLYAPCSRHLWRTLRVERSVYSSSGRTIASNGRFQLAIDNYWAKSEWLKYTRYVVLGRIRDQYGVELHGVTKLLQENKLSPNRVDFEILLSPEDIHGCRDLKIFGYLHDLKRYSESRSSQEFSILLKSNMVHSLPDLVDLSKVTRLTLAVSVEPLNSYSLTDGIEDLALVLKEAINVVYFSWEGGVRESRKRHITKIWDSLQKLQAVVAGLRHLSHLKIRRYLYHPSFFLVPPGSVRKLSLDCIASEAWWRSFARCPLYGVEILSIDYVLGCDTPDGLQGFVDSTKTKFDDVVLEDVAVRSLQKFSCNRAWSNIPRNLGECILRNNRGLDLNSRKEIKRRDAVGVIAECHKLYEREYRNCLELIVPRYTRKFAEGYEVGVEESLEFMAEWAEMLVLTIQPDFVEIIKNWIVEKDRAERAAGIEISCLGIEIRHREKRDIREDDREKARNFVVPLVYEFSGALRSVKARVVDAIAVKLAMCEEVGKKAAMVLLVEDVVARIQNVRQGIRDFN